MLTSHQIRAARALLHWSAQHLAEKAGVHLATVQRLELADGFGIVNARKPTVQKIVSVFESEGIDFISDDDRLVIRWKPNRESAKNCAFRRKAASDSDPKRPPIPI